MDKNTITFIVLAVFIIFGFTIVQSVFFPRSTNSSSEEISNVQEQEQESQPVTQTNQGEIASYISPVADDSLSERNVTVETNYLQFTFTTRGAVPLSVKLPAYHESDGSEIEMVISDESGQYPFMVRLGDYDTSDLLFKYSQYGNTHEFSRQMVYQKGETVIPFTVKKTIIVNDNEYLFEFHMELETEDKQDLPFDTYSFKYGPQIGPQYKVLDEKYDFRHFKYFPIGSNDPKDVTNELKDAKNEGTYAITEAHNWLAIEGKYFVVIGKSYISDDRKIELGFDNRQENDLRNQASLFFNRDVSEKSQVEDIYQFYVGPKLEDELKRYDVAEDNAFKESGLYFEKVIPGDWLGWLSFLLKIPLKFFYSITGNWGVAIIFLVILVKILFFPITHKSFESTSKMQALSPKMEELKAKYPKDPQKLNQAMAELYKREGVNPLGGCLPMLLQLPMFFALFSICRNFFDLRGAEFLPPWIFDLSQPEAGIALPFTIPLIILQINEIRFMPFIILGISIFQQQIMRNPSQNTNQMKVLMYLMPAVFFFIMYDFPSGVLIYWGVQSVFTFLQQYYFNKTSKLKNQG